eukprot:PhM_4_TR17461/c1_g1_i1/m.85757
MSGPKARDYWFLRTSPDGPPGDAASASPHRSPSRSNLAPSTTQNNNNNNNNTVTNASFRSNNSALTPSALAAVPTMSSMDRIRHEALGGGGARLSEGRATSPEPAPPQQHNHNHNPHGRHSTSQGRAMSTRRASVSKSQQQPPVVREEPNNNNTQQQPNPTRSESEVLDLQRELERVRQQHEDELRRLAEAQAQKVAEMQREQEEALRRQRADAETKQRQMEEAMKQQQKNRTPSAGAETQRTPSMKSTSTMGGVRGASKSPNARPSVGGFSPQTSIRSSVSPASRRRSNTIDIGATSTSKRKGLSSNKQQQYLSPTQYQQLDRDTHRSVSPSRRPETSNKSSPPSFKPTVTRIHADPAYLDAVATGEDADTARVRSFTELVTRELAAFQRAEGWVAEGSLPRMAGDAVELDDVLPMRLQLAMSRERNQQLERRVKDLEAELVARDDAILRLQTTVHMNSFMNSPVQQEAVRQKIKAEQSTSSVAVLQARLSGTQSRLAEREKEVMTLRRQLQESNNGPLRNNNNNNNNSTPRTSNVQRRI